MHYLIKGNAQQLCSAFGNPQFVEQTNTKDILTQDLSSTHFIGTATQANQHLDLWKQQTSGKYYTKGDMSAGILQYLLGLEPLKKADEDSEEYMQHYSCQHFAYINDTNETCGLMIMYRRDKPSQWMIGFVKKPYLDPKNREVILLSSFNLSDDIKRPEFKVTVALVPFLENQLMKQLGSAFPRELLKNAVNPETGEISKHFEKINLLMRTLHVTPEGATLQDPINYSKVNLSDLFAENPALDLIVQYGIHLSFAMLRKCLSEDSRLRKKLEGIKLTDDKRINKNLLQMLVIFYEEKMLKDTRELLKDLEFIRLFGGFMWDKVQIKLIPFLRNKHYSDKLMQLILSEEIYYGTVSKLVQLGLTEDIPQFFDNPKKHPQKLKELKYINDLPDEDCKKLCLVFWVKGSLSLDEYKAIVAATNKYPLMAASLVALDKTGTIIDGIDGLRTLIFSPKAHLKKSIVHHFFPKEQEQTYVRGLRKLKPMALEAASKALSVLRDSRITNREEYRLVLNKDKKGKALRILLPPIAAINDSSKRKVLIDVLYKGVKLGIQSQGNVVLAIKNKEQLALAKDLRERFICVTQLQDLKFKDKVIFWAAQENNKKAKCFRQIILRVETQCKTISERLSASVANREMHRAWEEAEADYRKKLYAIAYDALKGPGGNAMLNLEEVTKKIKDVEKDILEVIDPSCESTLYDAFIIITNILIAALTLGIANCIQKKRTGTYWFFNRSKSGEEVCALDKKIMDSIKSEDEEMKLFHVYKYS